MSIAEYIAKNLKSGKYQLVHNDKGTSAMWRIYAMIVEENGSVLDGFIFCRQCKKLIKYSKKFTSYAYRHKCYTALKSNESSGTLVDREEEISATTEEESNATYKDKTDDENDILLEDPTKINLSGTEESYHHIDMQIKKGVYEVREKTGLKSNVWAYFKTIHREDGSQIDDLVWCYRCEKIFIHRNTTSNLRRHKCYLNGIRKNQHLPEKMAKMNEDGTEEDISKDDLSVLTESEEIFGDNKPPLLSKKSVEMDDLNESSTSDGNFVSIVKVEESNVAQDENMWENDQQLNDDTLWEEDLQLNNNEELNKIDSSEFKEKLKNGIYKLMRKPNSRSMVWAVYDQIVKEDGNIVKGYVSCRNCKRLFRFNGKTTSNLQRHKCYFMASRSGQKSVNVYNKEEALNRCSLWIIQDCLPCSTIEGKGLRDMLNYFIKLGAIYGEKINIDDLMPDSKTVKENIHALAEEKKTMLKEQVQKLSSTKSVTVELWSDYSIKKYFLSVWLHFPRNYELNNIRLGVKSCDIQISIPNMHIKVEKLLTEFGIVKMNNIVLISDTPNAIKNAPSYFSTIICSNHLFATVVDTAIERTVELQEVIDDCKTIVQYCKKNSIKILKSSFCKTQCGLNYGLIKCIADNWQQLQEVIGKSKQPPLGSENLAILNHLVQLCQKFEVIFKKLQASRSPSLCFVIPSINIIQAFCGHQNNEDSVVSAFKTNILSSLEQFWLPHIDIWHKVAFFLYPPANKEQTNDLNEIKDFCIQQITKSEENGLTNENSINLNPDCPTSPKSSKPRENSATEENNFSADISFFFPSLVKKSLHKPADSPEDEVTRYSVDFVMIDENFNAIHWWEQNSANYPRLSKLALRILSIPASKTHNEIQFDLAKSLIAEKYDQFTPNAIDNILFLNCILQNNHLKPIV